MTNITWQIHAVIGEELRDGMCDAHTHGLDRYGSKEIQVVLLLPGELIADIINAVGVKVAEGLKLHDGMMLEGFFDDGASLKVSETKDSFGEPIFRLILPDGEFKFPEESNEWPYNLQYKNPYISQLN